MDKLAPDERAARTIMLTILLVVLWMVVATVGRSRGMNRGGEVNPLVSVLLVSCLLGGVGLSIAVFFRGMSSILAEDPIPIKLISAAAVFVDVITVILAFCYMFPYGLGT